MVVTRKTPVPMPPASRTPSTLSTPKVGKGKSSHSSPLSQDDGGSPVKMSSPNVKYVGPQFSDEVGMCTGNMYTDLPLRQVFSLKKFS